MDSLASNLHTAIDMDVFALIMAHADQQELWNLMRTCRAAYSTGMPIFLDRQVIISDPCSLAAFCRFVSQDLEIRAALLRSIMFKLPDKIDDVQIVNTLVRIINHASRLQRVKLRTGLLESNSILTAFAESQSIEKLALVDYAPCTVHLLQQMKSPVAHLELSLRSGEPSVDTRVLISSLEATLRILILSPSYHMPSENTPAPVFPRLTALVLEIKTLAQIKMEPLLHAFPNLQVLWIHARVFSRLSHLDESTQLTRLKNRQIQKNIQWRRLTHVKTTVIDMYAAALRCAAGRLEMRTLRNSETTPEMVSDILADLRPDHFDFTVDWDFDGANRLEQMPAVLRAAATDITHLNILIHHASDADSKSAVDRLIEILPSMRKIVFLDLWVYPRDSARPRNLEDSAVVRRIATAARHLEDVVLCFKSKEVSVWKIITEKATQRRDAREIPVADARRLGLVPRRHLRWLDRH